MSEPRYGQIYLKGDSIAITSTISPEARGKALYNMNMLLSIRAQQLAVNAMRSRVTEDRKCNLPDAVCRQPFDSKQRTVLDGLVQAPLPGS
jgi:hypothetical protein